MKKIINYWSRNKMEQEYLENEIEMFKQLGFEFTGKNVFPMYMSVCANLFCNNKQGNAIESFRRCAKHLLMDVKPRLTEEFNSLIELD